ncbi:MAG: DUF502 domain-containing protein [Desulfuromonadales bacterium]
MAKLSQKLNKYFLTGLVVLGPLGLTILVVQWIVGAMDRAILGLLPNAIHPLTLFGMHIPGLGVIGTLVLVFLVGMLASNIFGRTLLNYSEWAFSHTPGIKGIYNLFKQVTDTLFGKEKTGFRKVVLIEYPRRGIWTVAFLTGATRGELQRVVAQPTVNVFVPTTPNPTSGFFLLLPAEDVVELQMTVDEALKMVVSVGMVVPADRAAIQLKIQDGV